MRFMSSEENLHGHMAHHKVKQWLLDGCEREDARTIREAVERILEHRLIRRLARALAAEDHR
jgi:hypothetical protein